MKLKYSIACDLMSALRISIGITINAFYHLLLKFCGSNIFPLRALRLLGDYVVRGACICVGLNKFYIPDLTGLFIVTHVIEPNVFRIISSLGKDSVFIDIGAHIGKYTLLAARKGVLVIAIEPHPLNFYYLKKAVHKNMLEQKVICVNAAAYNSRQKLRLYLSRSSDSHSILSKPWMGKSIEMLGLSLDYIVKRLKLRRIDLIKIDVEGAELQVLEGSIETLHKYKPRLVVEVFPLNIARLMETLNRYGYEIKLLPDMREENVLYIYAVPVAKHG
ncbi:FkbM family methyltransferase [Desulfurococcus sp.]|uniref:FkbM family methyltransferase n=1 Tax=Desulfurococcus sp. TaxID=51678 RepID=UPI00319E949C